MDASANRVDPQCMTHRNLTVPALLLILSLMLAACSSPTAATTATTSPTPISEPSAEPTPIEATPSVSPTPNGTPEPTPPPATVTPTPTPEPEVPIFAPAQEMSALEETLNALAEVYPSPGEFSFAVTDMDTGETVGVNLDRLHLTGCTVNYFVLLQSTLDVQNGRIDESEVGDLIAATIRTSNPVTARELYQIAGDGDVIAGLERVSTLIDSLAGDDVVFDHPPLYGHESLGVDPNNYISAAAMNEALRATYADGVLQDEWLDYLLEKMTGVKDGLNYLLAVGPTVPVSHKNGFFPTDSGKWVDNDIGIVRFEQDGQERAYAVSFFSQFVPVKYGDVVLGQQLSTATWEFFQERYPTAELVAAPDTSDEPVEDAAATDESADDTTATEDTTSTDDSSADDTSADDSAPAEDTAATDDAPAAGGDSDS